MKGIKKKRFIVLVILIILASIIISALNNRTEEIFHYKTKNDTEVVVKGTADLDLSMNYTISVYFKKSGDIFLKKVFSTYMFRDHRGGWGLAEDEYDIDVSDNIVEMTIYQSIAFKKVVNIDVESGVCEEEVFSTLDNN